MKHFNSIKKWLENQEHLFYIFLFILIVPNIILCFTEPLPVIAKVCNVLLPFGCYYLLMTLSRNCGKMFWILFLFIFFGAFQIVLLYLFGQSIIAVDMFLNLVTTNSSEAMELLDNLIPALIFVVVLYVPALILAAISIIRKQKLTTEFVSRQRKRAFVALGIGVVSLAAAYLLEKRYEIESDLYPVNVCYNVGLAFQRNAQTQNYHDTSKDFSFQARPTHPAEKREVYVLVVGETARAMNWELYGYDRNTNPELTKTEGLTAFPHVLTESNTTHKSVPMLLSSISALNFDSIYYQKGIITAFKEAGYQTAFFSNQRYNNSFIDFFGKEADTWDFIKEDTVDSNYNPSDDELLKLVGKELEKGARKQFIVLHTYGSHFNYRERYPSEMSFFKPDALMEAEAKNRSSLVNAYDNTIRYTDDFLARLVNLLKEQEVDAAMLYTSDHGEDIFDDKRHLFLHASPVPSYYQLHVPFLVWMSDNYQQAYPALQAAAAANRMKNVSSSASFFQTMLQLGGVETPYRNDSLSVVSPLYTEKSRVYLNDHNEPRPLDDIGMKKIDFEMLRKNGISSPLSDR
ncbi:sulfatase-like hydrolase/transferase [Bacteroides sp.]